MKVRCLPKRSKSSPDTTCRLLAVTNGCQCDTAWTRSASGVSVERRSLAPRSGTHRCRLHVCPRARGLLPPLHETANAVPSFGDSGALFEHRLRNIEDAVRHNRPVSPDNDLEHVYQQLRKTWQTGVGYQPAQGAVDSLVSSIIGDINSLQAVLAGAKPESGESTRQAGPAITVEST